MQFLEYSVLMFLPRIPLSLTYTYSQHSNDSPCAGKNKCHSPIIPYFKWASRYFFFPLWDTISSFKDFKQQRIHDFWSVLLQSSVILCHAICRINTCRFSFKLLDHIMPFNTKLNNFLLAEVSCCRFFETVIRLYIISLQNTNTNL